MLGLVTIPGQFGLEAQEALVMSEDTLQRIDAKLSALLAIVIDSYLRQTDVARPKPRSIDKMLRDAGVPTGTIAALLGKTERAVQLQLAGKRNHAGTAMKARSNDGE